MAQIYYINGQYKAESEAHIGVNDLALLRGYGVFDFFRAIDGHVLFLDDHLARFYASAQAFRLAIPHSLETLKEIINDIIVQNTAPLLGIKLVLTGGYSPDGYTPAVPNFMVIAKPFSFMQKPEGMHLMSLDYLRELPEVKSLNYLVPIYHLPSMEAMGADDYLYHKNGEVTELSRSNVFIIKNERLITPRRNILHGVTRKHVLQLAADIGMVEERDITLEEVLQADEIFTSGSTKRILPITKIDGQTVGKSQKITTKLLDLFLAHERNQ